MRTLGDIRETLLIKKFGRYIKVKERRTAVSQAKIFCSDALTQHFFSHWCHFCIFVCSDCGTVEACDAFGVEIFGISNQIPDTQQTDFPLAVCHTNQSVKDISER